MNQRTSSLRVFSARRIGVFLFLDWPGALAMLFLAALLRARWGSLPAPLADLLHALHIPYQAGWSAARPEDVLTPQVIVLVALFWPIFLLVFGVYDGRRNETLAAELRNVTLAVGTAMAVLAGALYFSYRETSRTLLVAFFVLDLAFVTGSRLVWHLYRWSRNGRRQAPHRRVLVIGAGPVGQEAVAQLAKYAWADLKIIGYADDDPAKQGQEIGGLPVLGTLDQAVEIAKASQAQDAIVALPLRAHERLVEVCRALQKLAVHVHVIPDLFVLSFPSASLDGFGGIPLIDLGLPGIYGWRRVLKRAFDSAVAVLTFLLLSPLLLLVAALIKLESPGPVIYRQERVGENGRRFTLFKFRSMCAGADTAVHQAHVTRLIRENLSVEQLNGGNGTLKMSRDPRITRIGHVIRKVSVDELPQLWNVLRGEMSLVGPRPPIPYEVAVYQDWHKRRLEAIPGITGLWQIKGRNQVSFDEMVRMDLEYIERQSLWLDIWILIQTPLQVLFGRGAG